LKYHTAEVTEIITVDDEITLISAANDKTIGIWNWKKADLVNVINSSNHFKAQDHISWINKILLYSDQILVAAGGDGVINFWNYKTTKHVKSLLVKDEWIKNLYVLEDGSLASCGKSNIVRFWSI